MPAAAWACDECNTNNFADADLCRTCGAEKASSAGAVPEATQNVAKLRPTLDRPVFVASKHSDTGSTSPPRSPRSGSRVRTSMPMTSAPPRKAPPTARTSPPARKPPTPEGPRTSGPPRTVRPEGPAARWAPVPTSPAPIRPRRRGGTGRVVKRVFQLALVSLLGFGVISNWDSIVAALPEVDAFSGGSQQTDSARPCPAAAAQWLPGGADGATLVNSYTTIRHVITLCRDRSGTLYYDGQAKNKAVDPSTHLSVPAVATPTGYLAQNGTYTYEITESRVVVKNNGTILSDLELTTTGP